MKIGDKLVIHKKIPGFSAGVKYDIKDIKHDGFELYFLLEDDYGLLTKFDCYRPISDYTWKTLKESRLLKLNSLYEI